MSDICNECGKPKCECRNNVDNHRSANWCHGHAPQPTAQPVDLTELIHDADNWPIYRRDALYIQPERACAERDEIVLALRVLRVAWARPGVVVTWFGRDILLQTPDMLTPRRIDDAERLLGITNGGEK